MRCHAYQVPSEVYREIEAQILEGLRDSGRGRLLHLLRDHDLQVELLSGEWRVLFEAARDYYQVVDRSRGFIRMAVSPEELADFVRLLRDERLSEAWRPITFGLSELRDALPADCDLVGVVFLEESDDWQWVEPVNELIALRPEVFALLEPWMRRMLDDGDALALARLAADHAEGAVELPNDKWELLRSHAAERVPELLGVMDAALCVPADYTAILEALALVSDPQFQPSLDAWLRVHSRVAQYALYFRHADRELAQLDAAG